MTFPTAKLLEHAASPEELLASRNPFGLMTLAHLRTQQLRHDPQRLYAAKWQLTALLYERGWSKRRIIILFKAINWMMALSEPLQTRYWKAILRLEKERKVEWISPLEQSFIEKGRLLGLKEGCEKGLEQGLEKGLEKGRQEGAADLLERQLTQRFGPLSPSIRKKLDNASEEQLGAWGAALLEASTLKQLFTQAR